MTDERLSDLREASQWLSIPIDGSLVHELASEVNQLRAIANNHEVARLTQMIELLRNKCTELQMRSRSELVEVEMRLRSELAAELAEVETQFLTAKKTVDKQNNRLRDLKQLLSLCADTTSEPQAAKIIRESNLNISLPDRPSGDVGESWVQISATQLTRVIHSIPHTRYETIYGVYLDRNSDGMCYAFMLRDGRNFTLRCFAGLY